MKKEEEPLEREEEDHTKNQTRLFLLSKEKNSTCICDGGSDGRCWSQLIHFNIQFVERKNPLLCFFLNAKHSTPKKVSGWLLYVCDLYFSLCKSSKDLRFLQ